MTAKKTNRSSKSTQNSTDSSSSNLPRYELRLIVDAKTQYELEVWQLPSPATPRLTAPEYMARLKGVGLRLMEPRLLKRLSQAKISLGRMTAGKKEAFPVSEELALSLGLLFRVLAPMRSVDRITEVADGIDQMSREEAGYWLGMAMHRDRPRRVLAALRMLLTTP
ncbi:DUF7680 family protein [Planctomicrobium sp. SH527]|uniref:DUF7680 family protein n=1 Tax=Planctomicrobium sp. SH527 TaxID=3448123 RepID=UPI003F5C8BF2